ncbi:PilW family protein [Clostridium paraputrificum]|uniref:PilW family protein n=1 Tax=Clostridium paraputrificum TaxID=29363 RepID=UPI000DD0D8CC|nr:prepilin-type N-terminal cleavage/methylation domain-containing protein [Clostridium paraputrificum]
MKKKKGFTLVELIAVIGITTIFGAIVLGISITSGKLFSMTQSESVFNDDGRLLVGWIEDDLRTGTNIVETKDLLINNYDGFPIEESGVNVYGRMVLDVKVKENSIEKRYIYMYMPTSKKIKKMVVDGAILKEISSINDVEEFEVKKSASDSSDKRYFVSLKFKNEKNQVASFSATVMPRN